MTLATYNFDWAASDGFSVSFPVFLAAPFAPFSIAGYSLRFAMREEFGDRLGRLIDVTDSVPSSGGSSITLGLYQGVPCLVTFSLTPADALSFFVPRQILGRSQTKFYHQAWLTPPAANPQTAIVGSNFMRSYL